MFNRIRFVVLSVAAIALFSCQNPLGLGNKSVNGGQTVDRSVTNEISALNYPSHYSGGSRVPVFVTYTSGTDGYLDVAFKNPGNNWSWHGEAKVAVRSGTSTVRVDIPVDVAPTEIPGSIIEAKLYGVDGSSQLAYTSGAIIVTSDAQAAENKVIGLVAPDVVYTYIQGDITLFFENSKPVRVLTSFKDPAHNYAYFGGSDETYDTPHQNASVMIYARPTYPLPNGSTYIYEVKILDKATGALLSYYTKPFKFVNSEYVPEGYSAAYARSALKAGTNTVVFTLANVTQDRDVRVDLIQGASTWVAGTKQRLYASSASYGYANLSVDVSVPQGIDQTKAYYWSIKVLPLGGDWSNYVYQFNFDVGFERPINDPHFTGFPLNTYGATTYIITPQSHNFGATRLWVNKASEGPAFGHWVIHYVQPLPAIAEMYFDLESGTIYTLNPHGNVPAYFAYLYQKGSSTDYYASLTTLRTILQNLVAGRDNSYTPKSPAYPEIQKALDYVHHVIETL